MAAIAIVGMHRSGTSCLTGSLAECGLSLGDVNREAPHNKRGNLENPQIMALHEDVLSSNHGAWDHPPEHVRWSEPQRRERDRIIEGYRGYDLWGFKDPRTLLTLNGWLEAVPGLRLVGSFRHPKAVAASLEARNRMPQARGWALWLHYNALLLEYRRKLDFDIVCFDLPSDEYRAQVAKAARRLGLAPPARGLSFYDPTLLHGPGPSDDTLPEEVAKMWERLKRLSLP